MDDNKNDRDLAEEFLTAGRIFAQFYDMRYRDTVFEATSSMDDDLFLQERNQAAIVILQLGEDLARAMVAAGTDSSALLQFINFVEETCPVYQVKYGPGVQSPPWSAAMVCVQQFYLATEAKPKPKPKPNRRRSSNLIDALILKACVKRAEDPLASDAEIARMCDLEPSDLTRSTEYQAAKARASQDYPVPGRHRE